MTMSKPIAAGNSAEFMTGLVRDIVGSLDAIAGLDPIWKRGVVHAGGPHYRLKGTLGPVSLGEDECIAFGCLIEEMRPSNCFIIGNAFGMSSSFIAKVMEHHGGRSVVTLDSKSEGDGQRCFETAERLRERMNCKILANKVGWSPGDIDLAAEDEFYDLIFIDGDHSHPQVTRDFIGVEHLAREDSVLCWHDYWMAGVPESVGYAQGLGYLCIKINTSCEIVLGTKSKTVFNRIQETFRDTEPPQRRTRRLAYGKLYYALLLGAIKNHVPWKGRPSGRR